MSDGAAKRYETLRAKLLLGRERGSLSEVEEDSLLDEMDNVWWAMTAEEQSQSDRTLPAAEQLARDEARPYGRVPPAERLPSEVLEELAAHQRRTSAPMNPVPPDWFTELRPSPDWPPPHPRSRKELAV